MSVNLYPKLCIMFPNRWLAMHFADQCNMMHDLKVQVDCYTVIIEGADHPELRSDLIGAASIIGGDPVPEVKQ